MKATEITDYIILVYFTFHATQIFPQIDILRWGKHSGPQ